MSHGKILFQRGQSNKTAPSPHQYFCTTCWNATREGKRPLVARGEDKQQPRTEVENSLKGGRSGREVAQLDWADFAPLASCSLPRKGPAPPPATGPRSAAHRGTSRRPAPPPAQLLAGPICHCRSSSPRFGPAASRPRRGPSGAAIDPASGTSGLKPGRWGTGVLLSKYRAPCRTAGFARLRGKEWSSSPFPDGPPRRAPPAHRPAEKPRAAGRPSLVPGAHGLRGAAAAPGGRLRPAVALPGGRLGAAQRGAGAGAGRGAAPGRRPAAPLPSGPRAAPRRPAQRQRPGAAQRLGAAGQPLPALPLSAARRRPRPAQRHRALHPRLAVRAARGRAPLHAGHTGGSAARRTRRPAAPFAGPGRRGGPPAGLARLRRRAAGKREGESRLGCCLSADGRFPRSGTWCAPSSGRCRWNRPPTSWDGWWATRPSGQPATGKVAPLPQVAPGPFDLLVGPTMRTGRLAVCHHWESKGCFCAGIGFCGPPCGRGGGWHLPGRGYFPGRTSCFHPHLVR